MITPSVFCLVIVAMATAVEGQGNDETSCSCQGSIVAAVIITAAVLLVIAALGWCFIIRRRRRRTNKVDAESASKASYDNPRFRGDDSVLSGESSVSPAKNPNSASPPTATAATNTTSTLERTKSTLDRVIAAVATFGNKPPPKRSQDDANLSSSDLSRLVVLRSHDFTGLGFGVRGSLSEGLYVADVMARGPAAESKQVFTGDRIIAVTVLTENVTLEDAAQLFAFVSPYPVLLQLRPPSRSPSSYNSGSARGPKGITSWPSSSLAHPAYKSQSQTDLTKIKTFDFQKANMGNFIIPCKDKASFCHVGRKTENRHSERAIDVPGVSRVTTTETTQVYPPPVDADSGRCDKKIQNLQDSNDGDCKNTSKAKFGVKVFPSLTFEKEKGLFFETEKKSNDHAKNEISVDLKTPVNDGGKDIVIDIDTKASKMEEILISSSDNIQEGKPVNICLKNELNSNLPPFDMDFKSDTNNKKYEEDNTDLKNKKSENPEVKGEVSVETTEIKEEDRDKKKSKYSFKMPDINMPSFNFKGNSKLQREASLEAEENNVISDTKENISSVNVQTDLNSEDYNKSGDKKETTSKNVFKIEMPDFHMPSFGLKGHSKENSSSESETQTQMNKHKVTENVALTSDPDGDNKIDEKSTSDGSKKKTKSGFKLGLGDMHMPSLSLKSRDSKNDYETEAEDLHHDLKVNPEVETYSVTTNSNDTEVADKNKKLKFGMKFHAPFSSSNTNGQNKSNDEEKEDLNVKSEIEIEAHNEHENNQNSNNKKEKKKHNIKMHMPDLHMPSFGNKSDKNDSKDVKNLITVENKDKQVIDESNVTLSPTNIEVKDDVSEEKGTNKTKHGFKIGMPDVHMLSVAIKGDNKRHSISDNDENANDELSPSDIDKVNDKKSSLGFDILMPSFGHKQEIKKSENIQSDEIKTNINVNKESVQVTSPIIEVHSDEYKDVKKDDKRIKTNFKLKMPAFSFKNKTDADHSIDEVDRALPQNNKTKTEVETVSVALLPNKIDSDTSGEENLNVKNKSNDKVIEKDGSDDALSSDVESKEVDNEDQTQDVKEKKKHGFKINIPEFHKPSFGFKINSKENTNLEKDDKQSENSNDSNMDVKLPLTSVAAETEIKENDVDGINDEKKRRNFGLKMPEIHLPSFNLKGKSKDNVDVTVDTNTIGNLERNPEKKVENLELNHHELNMEIRPDLVDKMDYDTTDQNKYTREINIELPDLHFSSIGKKDVPNSEDEKVQSKDGTQAVGEDSHKDSEDDSYKKNKRNFKFGLSNLVPSFGIKSHQANQNDKSNENNKVELSKNKIDADVEVTSAQIIVHNDEIETAMDKTKKNSEVGEVNLPNLKMPAINLKMHTEAYKNVDKVDVETDLKNDKTLCNVNIKKEKLSKKYINTVQEIEIRNDGKVSGGDIVSGTIQESENIDVESDKNKHKKTNLAIKLGMPSIHMPSFAKKSAGNSCVSSTKPIGDIDFQSETEVKDFSDECVTLEDNKDKQKTSEECKNKQKFQLPDMIMSSLGFKSNEKKVVKMEMEEPSYLDALNENINNESSTIHLSSNISPKQLDKYEDKHVVYEKGDVHSNISAKIVAPSIKKNFKDHNLTLEKFAFGDSQIDSSLENDHKVASHSNSNNNGNVSKLKDSIALDILTPTLDLQQTAQNSKNCIETVSLTVENDEIPSFEIPTLKPTDCHIEDDFYIPSVNISSKQHLEDSNILDLNIPTQEPLNTVMYGATASSLPDELKVESVSKQTLETNIESSTSSVSQVMDSNSFDIEGKPNLNITDATKNIMFGYSLNENPRPSFLSTLNMPLQNDEVDPGKNQSDEMKSFRMQLKSPDLHKFENDLSKSDSLKDNSSKLYVPLHVKLPKLQNDEHNDFKGTRIRSDNIDSNISEPSHSIQDFTHENESDELKMKEHTSIAKNSNVSLLREKFNDKMRENASPVSEETNESHRRSYNLDCYSEMDIIDAEKSLECSMENIDFEIPDYKKHSPINIQPYLKKKDQQILHSMVPQQTSQHKNGINLQENEEHRSRNLSESDISFKILLERNQQIGLKTEFKDYFTETELPELDLESIKTSRSHSLDASPFPKLSMTKTNFEKQISIDKVHINSDANAIDVQNKTRNFGSVFGFRGFKKHIDNYGSQNEMVDQDLNDEDMVHTGSHLSAQNIPSSTYKQTMDDRGINVNLELQKESVINYQFNEGGSKLKENDEKPFIELNQSDENSITKETKNIKIIKGAKIVKSKIKTEFNKNTYSSDDELYDIDDEDDIQTYGEKRKKTSKKKDIDKNKNDQLNYIVASLCETELNAIKETKKRKVDNFSSSPTMSSSDNEESFSGKKKKFKFKKKDESKGLPMEVTNVSIVPQTQVIETVEIEEYIIPTHRNSSTTTHAGKSHLKQETPYSHVTIVQSDPNCSKDEDKIQIDQKIDSTNFELNPMTLVAMKEMKLKNSIGQKDFNEIAGFIEKSDVNTRFASPSFLNSEVTLGNDLKSEDIFWGSENYIENRQCMDEDDCLGKTSVVLRSSGKQRVLTDSEELKRKTASLGDLSRLHEGMLSENLLERAVSLDLKNASVGNPNFHVHRLQLPDSSATSIDEVDEQFISSPKKIEVGGMKSASQWGTLEEAMILKNDNAHLQVDARASAPSVIEQRPILRMSAEGIPISTIEISGERGPSITALSSESDKSELKEDLSLFNASLIPLEKTTITLSDDCLAPMTNSQEHLNFDSGIVFVANDQVQNTNSTRNHNFDLNPALNQDSATVFSSSNTSINSDSGRFSPRIPLSSLEKDVSGVTVTMVPAAQLCQTNIKTDTRSRTEGSNKARPLSSPPELSAYERNHPFGLVTINSDQNAVSADDPWIETSNSRIWDLSNDHAMRDASSQKSLTQITLDDGGDGGSISQTVIISKSSDEHLEQ